MLAGHLFLTNAHPFLASNIAILLLLGLRLVLFIIGRFFYGRLVGIPVQLVLLVLGIIAGYVLWPQTPVV